MQAEHLVKLQRFALLSQVFGGRDYITPDEIERDQRKQGRVVREAVSEGYVTTKEHEGKERLIPTIKAYDEIAPDSFDLVGHWDHAYWQSYNSARHLPYVRLGNMLKYDNLSSEKAKYLIENESTQWFIVNTDVIDRNVPAKEGDVIGPFETVEQLREAYRNIEDFNVRMLMEVVVSTKALADHAARTVFDSEVKELYPANLSWVLSTMGIVPEETAKEVANKMTGFNVCTGFLGGTKEKSPETWEANLNNSIETLHRQIAEAAEKLALLHAVQKGVTKFGGWDKFLKDSKERFIEALREKREAKETPATEA